MPVHCADIDQLFDHFSFQVFPQKQNFIVAVYLDITRNIKKEKLVDRML